MNGKRHLIATGSTLLEVHTTPTVSSGYGPGHDWEVELPHLTVWGWAPGTEADAVREASEAAGRQVRR